MPPKWKVADMASVVHTFCENSLIKNAKVILLMTQVFCMLPVSGVLKNDLQAIGFSYFTVKVILFVAITISISCMSVTYSVVFIRYHCRLTAAEYVVFYTTSFGLYALFFQIARKWKRVMRNWYEMDTIFRKYCGEIRLNSWQKSLIYNSIILATIEYILFIYWHVTRSKTFTGGKFLVQFYLGALNSDIYVCCGFYYNKYLFVCGQISSFLASSSILTANLFIVIAAMLIKKYIDGFYENLTHRLIVHDGNSEINLVLQKHHEDEWRAIRIDYNKISYLCETFDENISWITSICVTYQALFVLFHVLHILKGMDPPLNSYSAYYSLSCLAFQMLLLLFSTASVYESSRKIREFMYKTSQRQYNQEIEHLIWKTTLGKISFTLGGFYTVHRNLILNILGAIITYELFALQMKNES